CLQLICHPLGRGHQSVLLIRITAWLGSLALCIVAACATHSNALPEAMAACARPVAATPFDSAFVERLAGDYRLVMVSDSYPTPGTMREARLHLAVNRDTLRRFYRYSALRQAWRRWGERPLVGWLEGPLDEVHASWSGDPGSK